MQDYPCWIECYWDRYSEGYAFRIRVPDIPALDRIEGGKSRADAMEAIHEINRRRAELNLPLLRIPRI